MSFLKKIKQKWKQNQQQKQSQKTTEIWGLTILMDQLTNAMNPESYDVVKEGKLWKIVEKYTVKDEEGKVIPDEFEWKHRYSNDFDADKSGYFKTQKSAIKGLETIIKNAAKHFDQALEKFKTLNPDYEEA